jgi:hypothetical protein
MIYLHTSIHQSRIFCHDGDTPLTLQYVLVHDKRAYILVIAEDFALLEQCMHQCCLAMIDMRDNGDVPYIITVAHSITISPVLSHLLYLYSGFYYCNSCFSFVVFFEILLEELF